MQLIVYKITGEQIGQLNYLTCKDRGVDMEESI